LGSNSQLEQGSLSASGGAARAHGGGPLETRARVRWGPQGAGKGSGGLGEHGEHGRGYGNNVEAPEGSRPWWGGSVVARHHSGEQSHTIEGRKGKIRGGGRLVTLREDSGTLEQRQGHDEGSG
jgi:hypothetical protein